MITKETVLIKEIAYCDTNLSLEMTSKVENIGQKVIFTFKITHHKDFHMALNKMHWIVRYQLPRETGSEAEFGFGRGLMLNHLPLKAVF